MDGLPDLINKKGFLWEHYGYPPVSSKVAGWETPRGS